MIEIILKKKILKFKQMIFMIVKKKKIIIMKLIKIPF